MNGYDVNGIYAELFFDEQGNVNQDFLMLPLREVVVNGLGYEMQWDEATLTATVTTTESEIAQKIGNVVIRRKTYPAKTIKFTVDSGIIEVSDGTGKGEYTIPGDGKVRLSNGKLYVPDVVMVDVFGLEQEPVD